MSADSLAMYAGVVLSLVLSYVPGLNAKWEALSGEYKRLGMAALLLLVAIAVVAIACTGFAATLNLNVVCDQAGISGVVKAFVLALIANQGTYLITKK